MCLAASHWARLDAVFFAASAEDAAKAGFDDEFLYGEFRKEMLSSCKLHKLVDFPVSSEVFPNVEVKGGICYFLWSNSHKGPCEVTVVRDAGEFGHFRGDFVGNNGDNAATTERDEGDGDGVVAREHIEGIRQRVADRRHLADIHLRWRVLVYQRGTASAG